MEPQKFVLRLLDAADDLLGWAEVYATPRPQDRRSCQFRPIADTFVPIERDGVAVKITVHWCDLDVARMADLPEATQVTAGTVMQYHWIEPVWLVASQRDVPLPAVTVRAPVVIQVPTGGLMAAGV